MKKVQTLIKIITLLSREATLNKEAETKEYSLDLAENILNIFKKDSRPLLGGDTDIVDDLISLVEGMIADIESYDLQTVLDNLNIILKDHNSTLSSITKNLTKELSPGGLKNSVISGRTQLMKYYKEVEIKKMIAKVNYSLTTNQYEGNFTDFINNMLLRVESLNNKVSSKIPGLVTEIDLESDDSEEKISKFRELSTDEGKLKSGFVEWNDITQGGVSRGSMAMINALPHHYKSGLVQSFFTHTPIYNTPFMIDNAKKPLVVYISFEDDPEIFIPFMYTNLYYAEFKEAPDIKNVSTKEMITYMVKRLGVNGYKVRMLRINPADWTYKDLFNYILKLEAEGYEIHQMIIDYLAKMPATGCVGRNGTEYRDLYDRVRQFCSPKKISVITPHQMSTEAKQLLRNGENIIELPKLTVEKGYTEISKQLDQVVDLEVNIAKGLLYGKPVLAIMRGKHRGAPILEDKDKYRIMKFPTGLPIPPNVDGSNDKGDINLEEASADEFFL